MNPLTPAPELGLLVAESEIAYPSPRPLDDITFTIVTYNEERRLAHLLAYIRPWFRHVVVGVQESTDQTLHVAQEFATVVVEDRHRGYGDATYPALLKKVITDWCFRVDSDEWPEAELLNALAHLRWLCDRDRMDGAWIPFRSWVEGIEWKVPHSHLRFFRTKVGWPGTLHSRPMTDRTYLWQQGSFILHSKSLDEHIRGYLDYYKIGLGNRGWDSHNLAQIEAACRGVAEDKDWEFVKGHDWWPEVRRLVFGDKDPQPISEPIAVEP